MEGAPRTVSYLWLYPGLVGNPANPLPSGYATVPQVVDLCCDIFQRYGRECEAYQHNKNVQRLPRITPDLVARSTHGKKNVNILSDLKRMVCYLSREHTRWQDHQALRRFELSFIGTFIGLSFSNVSHCTTSAQEMIGTDRCFTDLYSRCLQALCDRFTVHFDTPDGQLWRPDGEVAA